MRFYLPVPGATLAGALAISLLGASAGAERAQAMPIASSPAPEGGAVTAVQYNYRDHYYRGYHHSLRRFGKAGVYNCGPMALHTHLQRNACGSNSVGRNGSYR